MLETISQIQPVLSLVFSIFTFIGLIIAVYKFSSEPDQRNKESLGIMRASCDLKHIGIDKAILEMNEDIKLIKTNHLAHIERDMNEIKNVQTRILAIMETREKYEKKRE